MVFSHRARCTRVSLDWVASRSGRGLILAIPGLFCRVYTLDDPAFAVSNGIRHLVRSGAPVELDKVRVILGCVMYWIGALMTGLAKDQTLLIYGQTVVTRRT